MSKCLNAQILIAVPIREAIPVADLAQGLQDQAVLGLGDHLARVRVDQAVLVMMIVLLVVMIGVPLVTVLRVAILVIGLLVVMIAVVLVIVLLVVILVIVRRVAMIAVVLMTVRLVATALALVGRLVRAVMTVVMAGDEAVPVKKTLLPASRAMRRSAGVQQFVPEVVVPFVRI